MCWSPSFKSLGLALGGSAARHITSLLLRTEAERARRATEVSDGDMDRNRGSSVHPDPQTPGLTSIKTFNKSPIQGPPSLPVCEAQILKSLH